jgi:hypothetical protein
MQPMLQEIKIGENQDFTKAVIGKSADDVVQMILGGGYDKSVIGEFLASG